MADLSRDTPAPLAGGAPEVEIARDLARRALPLGAALIVIGAIGWRADGALTSAFAVAVIVVNFLVAAALMAWAARISVTVLMGVTFGGFVLRMAVIALAVFAVKDQSWVVMPLLAFALVGAQLGLLFWETRHISGSMAYPGLKPQFPKEARP